MGLSCELKPERINSVAAFKSENSCDYVLQAGVVVLMSVFQRGLIFVSSQFSVAVMSKL